MHMCVLYGITTSWKNSSNSQGNIVIGGEVSAMLAQGADAIILSSPPYHGYFNAQIIKTLVILYILNL